MHYTVWGILARTGTKELVKEGRKGGGKKERKDGRAEGRKKGRKEGNEKTVCTVEDVHVQITEAMLSELWLVYYVPRIYNTFSELNMG